MNRLTVMVGLPFSGKSTYAQEQISRPLIKPPYPIVSPDAIRDYLYPYQKQTWNQDVEPLVFSLAFTMVHALFNAGHRDVVLDATNITKERRDYWYSPKWYRTFACVNTPLETCIERADQSHTPDMTKVILRMSEKIQWPTVDEIRDSEVPEHHTKEGLIYCVNR